MTFRTRLLSLLGLLILAILAGRTVAVDAHRLDEYLQATRLGVEADRINVEIDLTAGVSVAARVFQSIDANGDGWIAPAEGDQYARHVLEEVVLMVDGRRTPVSLVESQFPERGDMALGVGTIRVRGTATVAAVSAGAHQLVYLNTHKPETSVYLVNALVPSDQHIQIAGQRRDVAQRGLTLDYRVAPNVRQSAFWWLMAGLVMAAAISRICAAWRASCAPLSAIH